MESGQLDHTYAWAVNGTNDDQQLWSKSMSLQSGLHHEEGVTSDNYIWLIGFLSAVIVILVLINCSLRSNYFQENYLIARAKEWVNIPLLNQPPLRENSSMLVLSVESGGTLTDEVEPVTEQHHAEFCSWVSEADGRVVQNMATMKSISADAHLCDRQQLVVRDMSALAITDTPIADSTTTDESYKAEPTSKDGHVKSGKDPFFSGPTDLFLTKSESLDEARSRSDHLVREKCFKANKSVDEILSQQQKGGEQCSQSASFGTPKCRKLQERRGSNNSLTIAVKPAETPLPTVTTPRECSATQFLLTAGNVMSRRQLRACLKDLNAIHAEFWSIPTNLSETTEQVVARKNRYRYVLPNPHSRVKLPSTDPSDPASGYINANYIRAQNGDTRAYIATQGPLSNTISDFWQMVWTEKSPAIIMITKLIESGKAKCEQYLPDGDNSDCRYGDLIVRVDSVEEAAGCTIRHLSLKKGEGILHVTHYWYSDWPDHKTPDNPRTLVDLAVAVESLRRGQGSLFSPPADHQVGPIVVHCSAGVGRTGCFIAICQGLSQLVAEGVVDVLGIVCALRCDRGGMVQTAEQYEFIHRGLCLFERSTLSEYVGD